MEIVRIKEPFEVSDGLLQAMQRLCNQLVMASLEQAAYPLLDYPRLCSVVRDPNTALLMALDGSSYYIGTTTIHVWPHPVRTRAFIDDVVVDEAWRNRGVGGQLVDAALAFAEKKQAHYIELTCNSDKRPDAARLYVRKGFRKIGTDVYNLEVRSLAV